MTALVRHQGVPLVYPQPHDPQTTLWYVMIWDEALADQSATITQGSWAITPAPATPPTAGQMVIDASVIDAPATIAGIEYAHTCAVRIAGGTPGQKYTLSCTVTTSAGEVIQKSFILRCGQQ